MSLFKLADKFHTWTNSFIKERFPLVSLYYYLKPRLYWYWRTQPAHALIKKKRVINSDKNSILFFTVHKSASAFMANFIKDLSEQTGLIHIDYKGYFTGRAGENYVQLKKPELLKSVFRKKGYIYGPLRFYLDIPEVDTYPVLLLLRDPRDVLTSQFFSIRNTHALITKKHIERRKLAQSTTIDEHVKLEADVFLKTYNTYIEKFLNKENVLFLKYEDMIVDFNSFLRKINTHFGFNLSSEQLKQLNRTEDFKSQSENVKSHKRKVSSGDHKEKLKPETIEWLNKKFETVLKKLDYPIS